MSIFKSALNPPLDAPFGALKARASRARPGRRIRAIGTALRSHPELGVVLLLAGVLNLWALSRNGWANDYYSAAVRSMSTSWHDFLFGSMDPSGVMTVDKPPLALWVESLSVRVFGYHSLSILVPQALMGVASVGLVYDLVRRRFGRLGGFLGGLALATTPITVAISRHDNPDALLVLCCVAALWCAVRGLEDHRIRWLVWAGVFVGLGFETKMAVALAVVPGIVAAYLWVAPRGRLAALKSLLAGGGAMVLVGGAWPALVALTPAADRPWISGTSDNSIFSLIVGYNGVGRIAGQAGGPSSAGGGAGGGGGLLGGNTGPLRLINASLGGQDGWLLGFAVVAGLGILLASRARRGDPRTGWILAVGGSFAATAVVFSLAHGIFHPYYVSLLAPFVAALAGGGAAHLIRSEHGRLVGPVAIVAGVACEIAVLHQYPGQLTWLVPVLIVVGALAAAALIGSRPRVRTIGVCVGLGVLLIAPATWAADTLGYATNGTFPAGGPASAELGGAGGPGGLGGRRDGFGGAGPAGSANGFPGGRVSRTTNTGAAAGGAARPAFSGGPAGFSGFRGPGGVGTAGGFGGPGGGGTAGGFGGRGGFGGERGAFGGPGGGGAAGGGQFGGNISLTGVLTYVRAHGGGTLAVASQSTAATAIIDQDADVAGIGGFSGVESDISISWLAQRVSSGGIRWVLSDPTTTGRGAGFGGLPGDTRTGSAVAIAAAAKACTKVTLPTSAAAPGTLYDCQGRAAALSALAGH